MFLSGINGRPPSFKKWNQEQNYVIRDEVIEPADYTIAVKEGNHQLLSMINKSLTDLKAKGK